MMPHWLQEHLRAIGADNPDSVTRAVRIGRCPRCHAEVLRGLDGDLAAMPATTDPDEIDQYGEYLALIAGRPTYNLTRPGGRWEIDGRDLPQLRAARRSAVVASHRCGAKLPETQNPWINTESVIQTPTADNPPF